MTASMADFIASPEGAMYGRYCEHFGEHPGAIFSDDVMRFQVGVAYMLRDSFGEEPEPERTEGGIVTDLEARMR